MAKVLYLAVEKLRQYRLIASLHSEALLHLVCEFATPNYQLQRTVEHRGRTVLAKDCALARAEWQRRPVAEQKRWASPEAPAQEEAHEES